MYNCFVCKYVCTAYAHTVPEKCAGPPETGAVDGWQPPCGGLGTEPSDGNHWANSSPKLHSFKRENLLRFLWINVNLFSFAKQLLLCSQRYFCCVLSIMLKPQKANPTHSWQSALGLPAGVGVLLGHSHIPFAEFWTSLPQQGATPPGHILFPFFLPSIKTSIKFNLPLSQLSVINV